MGRREGAIDATGVPLWKTGLWTMWTNLCITDPVGNGDVESGGDKVGKNVETGRGMSKIDVDFLFTCTYNQS